MNSSAWTLPATKNWIDPHEHTAVLPTIPEFFGEAVNDILKPTPHWGFDSLRMRYELGRTPVEVPLAAVFASHQSSVLGRVARKALRNPSQREVLVEFRLVQAERRDLDLSEI